MEMEYAKVIHENCDTYAWAYDDATGLKACKSDKVTFTITFYDPWTKFLEKEFQEAAMTAD